MSHTLSLYRQLLKEVYLKHPKSVENPFANEVKTIYRHNQSITSPATIEALNKKAENVLIFLKSSRKHNELRERYSAIVLEQKKKIKMSARRVGLELPKEYDPNAADAATDRVMQAFQKP